MFRPTFTTTTGTSFRSVLRITYAVRAVVESRIRSALYLSRDLPDIMTPLLPLVYHVHPFLRESCGRGGEEKVLGIGPLSWSECHPYCCAGPLSAVALSPCPLAVPDPSIQCHLSLLWQTLILSATLFAVPNTYPIIIKAEDLREKAYSISLFTGNIQDSLRPKECLSRKVRILSSVHFKAPHFTQLRTH